MTTGNSSPFALCTVISRTPSLPSSRIGASAACACSAAVAQLVDEPAERHPAARFVLARQLGDVQHVGERLLAGAAQDEADVRARRVEQLLDRLGHRPVVAPAMQLLQQLRRLSAIGTADASRLGRVASRSRTAGPRNAKRMEAAEALLPLQQLLVADREQRAPQRREHRQLVVRPLDRGQRRADRLDLLAIVERLAADQHVMHAARLERADVGLRHVLAEAEEAPEQDADVARLDFDAGSSPARPLTFQPLSLTSQSMNAPTASGSDCSIFIADMLRTPYGSGHRQRDDRRLALDVGAVAVDSGT